MHPTPTTSRGIQPRLTPTGAHLAPEFGTVPEATARWLDLEDRLEAILFVADRPVPVSELASVVGVDRRAADAALQRLEARLATTGLCLQRYGREVQMVTAPEAAADVQRFLGLESSAHLSGAALETLAIVAYKQPVTRPEIEDLRGVNCDGVLRTLLSRGMVAEVGRRQTVGLPIEYGTSFRFLEYFGLEGLHELPDVGHDSPGAALSAAPTAATNGAAPQDAASDA